MLDRKDILKTQNMIDKQHLDIRTITMGISLLDCCDPDLEVCCNKIYEKITRCAKNLVKVGEDIEKEFGTLLYLNVIFTFSGSSGSGPGPGGVVCLR